MRCSLVVIAVLVSTVVLTACSGEKPLGDPELVSAVTGRVVRGRDSVTSARVELYAEGMDEPLQSQWPTADGRFHFPGLETGNYVVHAIEKGELRGEEEARISVPGEWTRTRLRIPDGPCTLEGTAVLESGEPFVGRVTVSEPDSRDRARLAPSVLTGHGGRFVVTGLPYGPVRIGFSAGETTIQVRRTFADDRIETFVVDEGFLEFGGRVVAAEDGDPLPGAEITWGYHSDVMVSARTDLAGRFRLRVPGDAVFQWIKASTEGRAAWAWTASRLPEDANVPLRRPARVSGLVRTPNGEPVAGARICAEHWAAPDTTLSDEEGRYELAVPPGRVRVLVRGGGWASIGPHRSRESAFDPHGVDAVAGESYRRDFTVLPAGVVEGRVTDAGGRPVPGVVLHASREGGDGWPESRVATGRDGRYRFEDLYPGVSYDLRAEAPGELDASADGVATKHGERVRVDLAFPVRSLVRACVVDRETGRPVPGLTVGVGAGPRARTGTRRWTLLEPVPFGEIDVWVRGAGRLLLSRKLPAGRNPLDEVVLEVDGEIDLEEPPDSPAEGEPEERAYLTVRALDQDGFPVSSGCTLLHFVSPNGIRTNQVNFVFLGVTGPIGPVDDASEIYLDVYGARDHRGEPLESVLVGPLDPEAGEVEVRLGPGRTISGRVTGPSGEGVLGAYVFARPARDIPSLGQADYAPTFSTAVTDPEGAFLLRGLGFGFYRLSVAGPPGLGCEEPEVPAGDSGVEIRLRRAE